MSKQIVVAGNVLAAAKAQITDMTNAREFRRNLIVLLAADGKYNAQGIAALLQIGERTVFDAIKKISKPEERPSGVWGGYRTSILTKEEEAAFLAYFAENSVSGRIFTVSEIHRAFMEKIGKKVPASTVYRMLHRNGWKKMKPDYSQLKLDPEFTAESRKKYLKFQWMRPV
ncbi:MAG: winged helix-turn-helix domain-containing protein [Deltaproteobacteria bacterium]|jgi:transposase|nr:winged helix-turn-helix domain-containing protein [Deltaproteobacteria bacterium]